MCTTQTDTTRYLIMNFNGEGCFGKVAECFDLITAQMVAVKIHKDSEDPTIKREVAMLEAVRALDPDKKNIVRFMEDFRFNELSCLAFEMLDRSVWDLMKERDWEPLSVSEIRPVTHQLLVAFEALKNIGIMHTDLKPDNIMLVNHKDQPFRIKLIDFGLARPASKAKVGMLMQANAYRAPEVTLGLPLSECVDMWGVGCVMAFMYFGQHLFPANCPYHWMKVMLHLLAQPVDHYLTVGEDSWMYFTDDLDGDWRLRTPEEYEAVTAVEPEVYERFLDSSWNLEDAVKRYQARHDDMEDEDRMAYLDLLNWCLFPHTAHRITPGRALKHPYVTMVHLVDKVETSNYADSAIELMTVSPQQHFEVSYDDWVYEESAFVKLYRHDSNAALMTDLQKEPSKGKDSSAVSFSAYNEDYADYGAEDSDNHHSHHCVCHCNSQSQSYSDKHSNTDNSSGYEADIESSMLDSKEPATSDSDNGKSIKPHLSHEEDNESAPWENDDLEYEPVKCCCGHSYIGNDADTKTSSQPASNDPHDEDPSPTSSTAKDIIEPNKTTGPSAATDLHDGVRDTTTPPTEEPGTTAPLNDYANIDSLPVASNTPDDRPSSDVVPTDEAAASIPLNDGAAAAIKPADADDIKTGPGGARRKTVFQRMGKFFRRVKKRVTSIFKRRDN
uniref:Protein kinase domain-containing protein n=1 Tax=Seriola lalandi dorsalis TaxID=1841481 RepID=A0A3B4WM51_SERLL